MPSRIEQALAAFPRVPLTRTPTPLQQLPHASRLLGPEIFLKRDDLTDLALGGDKPRKLEYELAAARQVGATHLVTSGSPQSNNARLTAAAARTLGLECNIVMSRDRYAEAQGNLLTVQLMGATVHFVDTEDHWDLAHHAREVCDSLRRKGHVPHVIPVSGTTPTSCLGYVRAGLELARQMRDLDLDPSAIYTPFGTGGIFSSMMLALRHVDISAPMIGISVNRNASFCFEQLEHWWSAVVNLLQIPDDAARGSFEIHDQFIGEGYGDATEACLDAIVLMARTEGILLDPVYSGKTFSGLVDHCRHGRWERGDQLVMLHSGGVPAIFAYHREIADHLGGDELLS